MPTSCFPVDAPAPAQPARASFPVRRAAAIACALFAASAAAVAQTAPALGQWTPTRHHSGLHDNPSPVEGVVWRDFVTAGQAAPWVRLEFDRWRLGRGSYLRVVSLADGDHQTLHAEHVEQWQSTSAYFNGGTVMVELVAGPHSKGNFVSIERVLAGDPPGDAGEDSICGTQDNRTPSANAAVGRIMSLGCSGWIISNSAGGSATNKLHLSAGHCYGASQVLQFAVPASGANCSLVMPPASKQFAIDTASSQYVNNGIGNDWWVFKCFPNPNTGRTSWQEQAAAFTLAAGLPATGTTLRNFGFGLDGTNTDNGAGSSCTCSSTAGTGTRNQTQQTHTGALASVSGAALYHTIDTCGGNSGSVLLDNASGQAVAIHTHAGCTSTGGANAGTAVTNAGLRSALQQMATTTHTLWAITVPETSSPASTTPWTNESYAAGAETCNDCNTTACQYSTNSTNGNTTPLRATDFQAFSLPAGQRIVNVRVEVSGRYDSNTTANVGFRAFAPAFGLNTNWRNSASFASGTLCAPRLGTTGDITSLSSSWTAAMINDLQFEVRRQASLSNNTLRVVSMRLIVTTSL